MQLLELAADQPARSLSPGEILLSQGSTGGDLFVLEQGSLAIERDGIRIASLATPGALLGEMSVLLGAPVSATVRAEGPGKVRVIRRARAALGNDPELTFAVARMIAGRLDATSAVLVELAREHKGRTEQGIFARIFSALHLPADGSYAPVSRSDLFGGDSA